MTRFSEDTLYCGIHATQDGGDLYTVAVTTDGRVLACALSSTVAWAKRDIARQVSKLNETREVPWFWLWCDSEDDMPTYQEDGE